MHLGVERVPAVAVFPEPGVEFQDWVIVRNDSAGGKIRQGAVVDAVFIDDGIGNFAAEEFFGGLDFEWRERHLGGVADFSLNQRRDEIGEMPVSLADAAADVIREVLDVRMGHGSVFDGQWVAIAVETPVFGEGVKLLGKPSSWRDGDDQIDAGAHHLVDQLFFIDDAGVVAQVNGLLGFPDVFVLAEVAEAVGEADVIESFKVAMSPHDDWHRR